MPLLACVAYVAIVVLSSQLGSWQIPTILVAMAPLLALVIAIGVKGRRPEGIESILLFPTILSAFQNVYLLPIAEDLQPTSLQIVVVANFVFAVLTLGTLHVAGGSTSLSPQARPMVRRAYQLWVASAGFGLAMMAVRGNDPIAAFASLRNVSAPFLFLLIGMLASSWVAVSNYARLLAGLALLVVAFGFWEYLNPGFWRAAGISVLWEKKGIPVDPYSLIPKNFFSSEVIGGRQVRRMVGPFADPVNFGTFLFAGTMASWYVRRRATGLVTMIASALAVSKGAVLGWLVMAALWVRDHRSRFEFVMVSGIVGAAALAVYSFTTGSSTGSTTAHVNGFLAAFTELPSHPLGRGLGGTGVLAGLFSDGGGDSAIVESGIGMVLGQLGVVGLVTYAALFGMILRQGSRILDRRDRTMCLGLTAAFAANAMFNEVALSPNSCAPYFIMVGLILARSELRPPPQKYRKETVYTARGGHWRKETKLSPISRP